MGCIASGARPCAIDETTIRVDTVQCRECGKLQMLVAVPEVDRFGIAWKRPNHNVIDAACEDCGARLTKFDTLKAMKARGETTTDRMLNSRSHREERYKQMKAQSEDSYNKQFQAQFKEAEPKLALTSTNRYEERVVKRIRAIEETSAKH
jgi:hypothetical protein